MRRKIIPYNRNLKLLARELRNNSTKSEIKLWQMLKGKQLMGFDFHRQKPLLDYIVDFYCYELNLVIELDGYSHQFAEVQEKDQRKQNALEDIGLKVMRFEDGEVMQNVDEVMRILEVYVMEFEG
ncbi:MAG: very-short-patch-repair endonuclease [Vicingaceae bacterium]|jgi:very-short-patch-repair endonuclease